MGTESFYYHGRSDCLQRLPANPRANNPQEHNDYMSGYNSVQQQGQEYSKAFQDICGIIVRHQNLRQIKDITLRLAELLAASINEPADRRTNLDEEFKNKLFELRKYDSILETGIRQVYNAVQKSKRFELRIGELTKQLNYKPVEEKKLARKKKKKE